MRAEKHPDDAGVFHKVVIDSWTPDHPDAEGPIEVCLSDYGHTVCPDQDYPDDVLATGDVFPGFLGGVGLRAADARRLGQSLIRAADALHGATR